MVLDLKVRRDKGVWLGKEGGWVPDRRAVYTVPHTLTMSCWGMPSVITTTNGTCASMASMMALAAWGGGT